MENVKNKGERKAGVSKGGHSDLHTSLTPVKGRKELEMGELVEGASATV